MDVRRLVLVLMAASAAGCGGGSGTSEKAPTAAGGGAAVRTVTIDETEFALTPARVSLDPGTYVFRGVNKGSISHALAVEGNGVDEDGPTVEPGGASVVRVTLTKPGSYELYCPVDGHKAQGMRGELTIVGAAGSSDGASTQDEGASTSTGDGGY